MSKPSLVRFCTCLAALFSLAHCTADRGNTGTSQGGSTGGDHSTGGSSSSGGANGGAGGTSSTGGTTAAGGTTSSGGSGGTQSSGGTRASGGSATGGTTASGGSSGGSGGTKATGGTTSSGGTNSSGGTVATGGTKSSGGTTSTGGTTASGGTTSTGGTTAPRTDCLGQALAKAGDSTSTSRKYLNLGDIRLINNRWGADALGCSGAQYTVSVNSDKSAGYTFNRPTCGGKKADPDYPEFEFGVAPFGANSSSLTSPACSSTTLLPAQIKNITSATVNFDSFVSTYQKPGYYDSNFEFWISKDNPLTAADPGVYAEIIAFLGWDSIRNGSSGWPCDKSGTVTAGGATFVLCHQKDGWGSGWRFFNFDLSNGPQNTFSSKVDVKAMLTWVMQNYTGFTTDMWLTRIEVGTEVDDDTQGTAKVNNLTFEINGTSKSFELGQ